MIGGRDRVETDLGNERRRQLSAGTTGPEESVMEVVSYNLLVSMRKAADRKAQMRSSASRPFAMEDRNLNLHPL